MKRRVDFLPCYVMTLWQFCREWPQRRSISGSRSEHYGEFAWVEVAIRRKPRGVELSYMVMRATFAVRWANPLRDLLAFNTTAEHGQIQENLLQLMRRRCDWRREN